MEDLTQALLAAAAALVPVVFGVLTLVIRTLGKTWTSKIEDDSLRERVQMATTAVESAVYEVSQVLVPQVREAAADGKIDDVEREKLREAALKATRRSFSAAFWLRLQDDLDLNEKELTDWLVGKIEAKVFSMKKDV